MSERKELSPQDKMRAAAAEERRRNPWLVIFGGITVTALVVSCLLCAIGTWGFRPHLNENPEQAARSLNEMVSMQVPASFQPHGTIDWNLAYLLQLRGVYYELFNGDGVLTLVEVNSRFSNQAEVRRHIRETLLESGAGGTALVVDQARSREEKIKIDGQEVPFQFEVAEDPLSKKIYHLVEGAFSVSGEGELLLTLRVDADHWDPESIQQMLKSIGPPPR